MACNVRRTPELSDRRPAVVTPTTLGNHSASPKPATPELRSGAAVRSSDLVRHWNSCKDEAHVQRLFSFPAQDGCRHKPEE